MRRAILAIMQISFLVGMLAFASDIRPVEAAGTIYIRSDGSVDPSTTPIKRVGDTYTFTDDILNKNIVVERNDTIIDGDGYTLQGNGAGYGFGLFEVGNITIMNTAIREFEFGIHNVPVENQTLPRHFTIHNNTITSNDCGVRIIAVYVIISENVIVDNGVGIVLEASGYVNIVDNDLTNNEWSICFGYSCKRNQIVNNSITHSGVGIHIAGWGNDFNDIVGNRIAGNDWGIYMWSTSDNSIYHNLFVGNSLHVSLDDCPAFAWDDDYPSGGNYWDDYDATDSFSGPYQNETGSDGIGDIPYIIDAYNQDRYPFMNPWNVPPLMAATVDIHPQVLNLRSSDKWITAYIEVPEGFNVADIDVSSISLRLSIPAEPWSATIGDYDEDGILDLMVKFNRTLVVQHILSKGIMYGDVALWIIGQFTDGSPFGGNDFTRVSALAGDVNCDEEVNIYDAVEACTSYGSREGEIGWNSNANFAPPWNRIDIYDLVTIAYFYGKTHLSD